MSIVCDDCGGAFSCTPDCPRVQPIRRKQVSKTIWKFTVPHMFNNEYGEWQIDVPLGSIPLTVQIQNGVPHVWVEVDPESPVGILPMKLKTVGTGRSINTNPNESWKYVGTYQLKDFVWHLYWNNEVYN